MIGVQAWGSTQRSGQKPDASQLIEGLFTKLDTKNQGYVDKSELETALSAVNTSSSTDQTSKADALFVALDSDGDGKVTKDEFSAGMQSLADQLMSQLHQSMRGMGPPPPPPTDGADEGLTKDQLTEMAASGDAGSKGSAMLSNLVANFDAADTDENGKVSAQEAMAYARSQQAATSDTASSVASSGDASGSASGKVDDSVLMQFLKLIQVYASTATSGSPVTDTSTIAVSA
jgi:Ca2+-binding EF-hand superfamily protein